MGSLQGERALCRNSMNEVSGDITHHPKIKSIWGSQLRLKPQTLHRFFALQLFFSSAFFQWLRSTSSNPKWALSEVLQFRILCWLLQPPHRAQHKREHLYPPACTYIKSALKPVVKPDSKWGSVPSVLPTESALSSSISQVHTRDPGLREVLVCKTWSSWSVPISPVLVHPRLHTSASTIVWSHGKSD